AGRTTADEYRQHRDPRRRRRRLQPDRATQGEDDHPRSSVSDTRPSMHAAGPSAAKRTPISGRYGSTSDLNRRLSGFRAECLESGRESGASRPEPDVRGAEIPTQQQSLTQPAGLSMRVLRVLIGIGESVTYVCNAEHSYNFPTENSGIRQSPA